MTAVMGIVNVTPDSFSDAGRFLETESALAHAKSMAMDGASIIDFGAESTRPGFTPVTPDEELARLKGVFAVARKELPGTGLSIDTRNPSTALAAIEAGFEWINCVDMDAIPAMAEICSKFSAKLIMPVKSWTCGGRIGDMIDESLVYIDPMIGFGTTREEDIALFKSIGELSKIRPTVVGISRKRILGHITGVADPTRRDASSIAAALLASKNGASIVRVHDAAGTVQALKILEALS